MMLTHKFNRKNKTITDITTGVVSTFDSINQAKKESRKLQQANGGLGCGSMKVIK